LSFISVTSIVTCVVLELVSLNPYRKEGIFIPGELDFGRVNILEITQFPDFSARQQLTDTGELGARVLPRSIHSLRFYCRYYT
jgi:hypothetical protein